VTEPTPDQEAVTAAQALTKALEGMSRELAAVNKRQDRMRHVVIGLTVSLVLDVLLTVVVAVFAVTARDASDASNRNGATLSQLHASQVQGCLVNNDSKNKQAALWAFVVAALQPPASDTSAQKAAAQKFLAKLERHIANAYMVRDCQQAYKAH
jgi:hypothetical protein